LRTALVALAPRLATPAQLEGLTYARYSSRNALTAHEAIRAYFALYGPKGPNCLRLAQSTRLADVLAFIARNEQPGMASYLHKVRTMISLSPIAVQSKSCKKRGLSASAHDPMMACPMVCGNPKSLRKACA